MQASVDGDVYLCWDSCVVGSIWGVEGGEDPQKNCVYVSQITFLKMTCPVRVQRFWPMRRSVNFIYDSQPSNYKSVQESITYYFILPTNTNSQTI
jgi:hypothetical protein